MKTNVFTPFKSLNPAYFRLPVVKQDVDDFEKHLNEFKSAIKPSESEEYNKNVFTQFLYNSFYNGKNKVNTKGRIDLAIYEDETPIVIFEFKKPKPNDADMVSKNKLNAKSIHQLIKYYFDERVKHNNTNIKFLIITNAYEWFVFDERDFDKEIYCNAKLKKDYETCLKEHKNDDYFYRIAESFLEKEKPEFKYTYFDLREQKERAKVRTLYKFFSPQHLLKQSFVNDSNSLNKEFYNELLHIIGLEETKDGSKKIITRKSDGKRDDASLLENVIYKLKQKDKLSKLLNPSSFGESDDERYFHVALELCITWINRILFLKLLESQLIRYHNKDPRYKFLSIKTIHDYDELGNLFFSVLAKESDERDKRVKEKFSHVPYLNSSLFEESDLEKDILSVENLDNSLELDIFKSTKILYENKPLKGKLKTLEYLFRFLDTYNFASEGADEEQEDHKALINASVLGLMFEKLNGYKDGSFFTPGFITMYMCRETLRRAVVQKFNEKYEWKCETLEDIYNHLRRSTKDILIYNEIINDLKICDPAVGSGHFLVSALNELIAIKNELGILADKTGKILPVNIRVANDELMVEEGDEKIFEYHAPVGKNSKTENQRIQETLFHEKEKIIEHCLFGVDINGNSVKICRLRLWIELLKNAYYTDASQYIQLETLPNIDINIKRGNSLISRFALDSDLTSVFKQQKFNYSAYRNTVEAYKEAPNKKVKENLLKFIKEIKEQFKTTFYLNNPINKQLSSLRGQLALLDQDMDLFGKKIRDESEVEKQKKELQKNIIEIEKKIIALKENEIYRNSFEWRFEFPEVMDKNGNFVGFDVVIGNPPYLTYHGRRRELISNEMIYYFKNNYKTIIDKSGAGKYNSVMFFIEKSFQLGKQSSIVTFIIDISFYEGFYKKTRDLILQKSSVLEVVNGLNDFADVGSGQLILSYKTENCPNQIVKYRESGICDEIQYIPQKNWLTVDQNFKKSMSNNLLTILTKIETGTKKLDELFPEKLIRTGESVGIKENGFVCESEDAKSKVPIYPYVEGSKSLPSKYSSITPTRFFKFDVNLLNERNTAYRKEADVNKRKNAKVLGIGDELAFKNPKILIRQSCESLCASYSEKTFVYNRSYYSISNINSSGKSKFSLLFTLALINSKLLNYYAVHKPIIKNDEGKQPQIRLSDLKTLPIKIADNKTQEKIETLANQILTKKNKDLIDNTSEIENQIDQLVYQLYDLTEEEIKLVEGKG